MRQLVPAMTALAVVALVASVGYAEAIQDEKTENPSSVTEAAKVTEAASASAAEPEAKSAVAETELDHPSRAGQEAIAESDAASEGDAQQESSSTLSVAPMTHVTYPDDWPLWADAEPDLSGPVHTWPVSTGGCKSIELCEEKLGALVRANVALYIKESTGWVSDGSFLSDQWIDDEIIVRRYVGKIVKGDEELDEIAVELEFDSEVRAKIQRAMNNDQLEDRLRASSGLFVIALIGLCCSGGLLGVISRRYA